MIQIAVSAAVVLAALARSTPVPYQDFHHSTELDLSRRTPIGLPVHVNSKPWDQALCTQPEITDADTDPFKRWLAVDSNGAWQAALNFWKNKKNVNGNLGFSREISNFFHGPEQRKCGDMDSQNGCSSTVECSQVNHPGGFLILNSFTAISNANWNLYDAIRTAQSSFDMPSFTDTFAPPNLPPDSFKIFMDVTSMIFSVAMSPVWNSKLKSLAYFKSNPNTLGTIKDTVNPLVTNSITLAKDTTPASEAISQTIVFTEAMKNVIGKMGDMVTNYNEKLFDGSDESIDLIGNLISAGRLTQGGNGFFAPTDGKSADTTTVANAIAQSIYAWLIPKAWGMGADKLHPFILDSGKGCDAKDPDDIRVDPDVGGKYHVCIDNKLYYLVAAGEGPDMDCSGGGDMAATCSPLNFGPLPGADTLNNGNWGGITVEDFVTGAVASYRANGNKNGWNPPDPSDLKVQQTIWSDGVRAPGVIPIPVCGGDEAWNNWQENGHSGKFTNYYPCT